MSDQRSARGEADRTARVWASADFLHPDGPGESFRLVRWSERIIQNFEIAPPPPLVQTAVPEEDPWSDAVWDEPAEMALEALPALEDSPATSEGGVSQEALEEARLEAYTKGQEHGRLEAQQELLQAGDEGQRQLRERIASLEEQVAALGQSPERLHEPLKRLALHLAEQLVMGELSQSPQAIERLVQRCVEELGSRQARVQVELHPDDLALLQPWLERPAAESNAEGEASPAEPAKPWQLVPNEQLKPGSVRACADDAVVSDLIEHRLDALARQLLLDPQRSARQSAFQPDRLAARRSQANTVLDAQPRMAEAARSNRFAPVVEAEAVLAPEPAQAVDTSPAAESVSAEDAPSPPQEPAP